MCITGVCYGKYHWLQVGGNPATKGWLQLNVVSAPPESCRGKLSIKPGTRTCTIKECAFIALQRE